MYRIAVSREFYGRHYHRGIENEREGDVHDHHYRIEARVSGADLDERGYLVDVLVIREILEGITTYFADRTLNDLSEFYGINPSAEHLARAAHGRFRDRITLPYGSAVEVVVWESGFAWASYSD
jgi:6-pyruvoyltetrahydropterin/6-carboxytetrahydropterin synthase